MEQLTLEVAAHNHYPIGYACSIGSRGRSMYEHKKDSFIAGAKWALKEASERALDYLSTKYPKEAEILHDLQNALLQD